MTLREQIIDSHLKLIKSAPPGSNWFVRLIWAVIDLDEPGLVALDSEAAEIIWPEYAPHTISWNLGRLIKNENDPEATAFCSLLAQFLGPDHCVNAYEHGE